MPVIGPNFAFLCVPRTGTNMMAHGFLSQFGGKIVDPYHGRVIPPEHAHKFTFAIVRNPYDWMLSCWYHLRRHSSDQQFRQMGLLDYVRHTRKWADGAHPAVFLGNARVDAVLRFEDLENEIHRLPFVPADARLPVERYNTEERPAWRDDLTPEFIRLVNNQCRESFVRFGYEMQPITEMEYAI